jgi:hypothetical protein
MRYTKALPLRSATASSRSAPAQTPPWTPRRSRPHPPRRRASPSPGARGAHMPPRQATRSCSPAPRRACRTSGASRGPAAPLPRRRCRRQGDYRDTPDHKGVGHQEEYVAAAVAVVPRRAMAQRRQRRLLRRGHPRASADAAPGFCEHIVARRHRRLGEGARHGVVGAQEPPDALAHWCGGARRCDEAVWAVLEAEGSSDARRSVHRE